MINTLRGLISSTLKELASEKDQNIKVLKRAYLLNSLYQDYIRCLENKAGLTSVSNLEGL